MIISERIFKILNDKHISQSSFAKEVGLAASTISDWKTKKTNPTAEKIITICEVLRVTPEQLLTGKGIDGECEVETSGGIERDLVLTDSETQLLKDFQGLKETQRKRLLKYMEALKQIEELEELG